MSSSPRSLLQRLAHPGFVDAVALFVILFAFRLEKALVLELPLGALGWVRALWPDLALAAILGATARTLYALVPMRHWRRLRVGHLVALAFVGVLACVEHQFFLSTGTGLRWGIALYALENVGGLGGVLGTGLDLRFLTRLALVGLCVLLAWRMGRSPDAESRPILARAGGFGVAAAALLALGLSQRAGATPIPMGVVSFLDLGWSRSFDEPVDSLYEAPRLTAPAAKRPLNVVMLVLESTRADAIDPPNGAEPAMPYLQALSQRGVAFTSAWSAIPHTTKALVTMFCGMYPRLRIELLETVPGNLPLQCLPRLLGDLGYQRAFFQTAPGAFEKRPTLLANLGFEEQKTQEDLLSPGMKRYGYFGLDEGAMLQPALDYVAARRVAKEPFLLGMLTVTTHHPYATPEHPDRRRADHDGYREAARHVDGFARALFEGLERQGALDDTLVVVVGDHGEAFGEHKARRQHDVVPYQEVLHVPLFLLGPKDVVGPPRRVSRPVSQLDIVPTVLEALGVSWQGRTPGHSLLGDDAHPSVFASCHYDNYCMAERRGNRVTVFHYDREPTEVFDLASDPFERKDLAATTPAAEIDAAVERMLRTRVSVDAFYRDP